MNYFLLITVAVTTLACSSSTDLAAPEVPVPSATGTSDGGGGVTQKSSKEQVEVAVLKVKREITDKLVRRMPHRLATTLYFKIERGEIPDDGASEILLGILWPRADFLRRNIKNEFFDNWALSWVPYAHFNNTVYKSRDFYAAQDLLKGEGESIAPTLLRKAMAYPDSIRDYLKPAELFFEKDGPCLAPDKDNADASVTQYSFTAVVCFSTSTLQRFGPTSLLSEVAGLWGHELAHMNGYEEADAVKVASLLSHLYTEFDYISQNSLLETKIDGDGHLWQLHSKLSLHFSIIHKNAQNKEDRSKATVKETLKAVFGFYHAIGLIERELEMRLVELTQTDPEKICLSGEDGEEDKSRAIDTYKSIVERFKYSIVELGMPYSPFSYEGGELDVYPDGVSVFDNFDLFGKSGAPNSDWFESYQALKLEEHQALYKVCGLPEPAEFDPNRSFIDWVHGKRAF